MKIPELELQQNPE